MSESPQSGSADLLRAFVERLEDLMDQRADINSEMSEVRAQAKLSGFDVPTITLLLKRRQKDPEELIEADGLLETYEEALGCGAAAAGVLATSRNADGTFEVKMVQAPDAEEKLSRSAKARRDAIAAASLAAAARDELGAR